MLGTFHQPKSNLVTSAVTKAVSFCRGFCSPMMSQFVMTVNCPMSLPHSDVDVTVSPEKTQKRSKGLYTFVLMVHTYLACT